MDLHPLLVRVLRENLVTQDFLVNLVCLGQKDGMERLENLVTMEEKSESCIKHFDLNAYVSVMVRK